MILEKKTIDNKSRYIIQERCNSGKLCTIAYYESLEQAALVMRYLKGASMQPADQAEALRLIFEWDARESLKPIEAE